MLVSENHETGLAYKMITVPAFEKYEQIEKSYKVTGEVKMTDQQHLNDSLLISLGSIEFFLWMHI